MIVVNRREIKYSISDADYYRYLNLFNEILKSDPHSKNGGYTIRSLYFDTFTDDDYYSKMNGEEVRKKNPSSFIRCKYKTSEIRTETKN